MHGNTQRLPGGEKTRVLTDLMYEVKQFITVLGERGIWPGGLHLEVTPDAVTECVDSDIALADGGRPANYASPCDPRLNPQQAGRLVRFAASEMCSAKMLK
jgi:3-deoxy-7-phosphoheptulonate synthase